MANIVTIDITKLIPLRTHAFFIVLACVLATIFIAPTKAIAQTKTLKLYYLHTGEKNTITYYKNGKYRASALKKINWALRDWRRNEPTKMDPKLLDLVWEAYRRSGSKAYIHVISGYRSPITNEKLRKRGGGQAKKSQHTLGKALDFYLPDVKISKMRSIGLKMGVGGVGYYPRSGSPFVHLDTGSVRHWPRMTRTQLAKVFPRGKTMHIPTDGKPLAKYKVAVAEYKSRSKKGKSIPTSTTSKKDLNFFQRLAARSSADESEDAVQSAPILPRVVKSVKAPTTRPTTVKPVIGTTSSPAEVEIAAPLSITEPLPKAPPNEDDEPKPEFAILAQRTIPLPIRSPRKIITPASTPQVEPVVEQIVVAELAPEQQVEKPAIAQTEILTPEKASPQVQDATIIEPIVEPITEQVFTVPTPIKRPNLKQDEQIQLASLEPAKKESTKVEEKIPSTLNQPALTANEIEDLRNSTTPKLVEPKPKSQAVPQTPPIVVALAPEPLKEKPVTTVIETARAPIVVASKVDENIADKNQLALEEETSRLAKDIQNNKAITAVEDATEEKLVDASIPDIIEPIVEPLTQTVIALKNIPIPTQNPRFIIKVEDPPKALPEPIVSASLEPETIPVSETSLGKRTVSLDRLSAPQENENTIGQYAIANHFNIRDLNAVKAPTYGRNVLRKAPTAVFVDGFKTSVTQRSSNGFSGKAIVFKKFARLTK